MTDNSAITPFTPRLFDWEHMQSMSCEEIRNYLIGNHIMDQKQIIFKTQLTKLKDFIILYGYKYDNYYISAVIISPENKYSFASIAATEKTNNSLLILDIKVNRKEANRGYGSILLKQLIKNAIENGKESITGTLTPADLLDHGERLVHFYKKHGFKVEIFGNYGKIKWINSSL
jgi:GNAT superfamily N-acetyltransferase